MTSYDETAGTEDPKSLLNELRASFSLQSDDQTVPDAQTTDEEWAERYLQGLEFSGSAVVAAAADLVISPRSPRPEARKRMIDAATRALAERRKMNGLLPVLLRAARESAGLSLGEVSAKAELTEALVGSLESGRVAVDLRLNVDTVVAWIRAIAVPRDAALKSLERSLRVGWTGDSLLAAGSTDLPANVDDYIALVMSKLEATKEQA